MNEVKFKLIRDDLRKMIRDESPAHVIKSYLDALGVNKLNGLGDDFILEFLNANRDEGYIMNFISNPSLCISRLHERNRLGA